MDEWQASDIFRRRTFSPAAEYSAATPQEALAVSLNTRGRVDVDYMASPSLDSPRTRLSRPLCPKARYSWTPRPAGSSAGRKYLSGTVKAKLEAALRAAEDNPSYRTNVAALEQVQPERIEASDIYISLGSTWIPEDVVNEGLAVILSDENRYNRSLWRDHQTPRRLVEYSPETGTWGPAVRAWWGGATPSLTPPGEPETFRRPGSSNTPSPTAPCASWSRTTRANNALTRLAPGRPSRRSTNCGTVSASGYGRTRSAPPDLEEVYNESQNISIPRQYDPSHLTFPGMTAKWQKQLLPHQREAVDRVVQDGNVMLAHEVGFGKTASMVGAAMERKRLGLSQKPMFVLPNATAAQFAADFREMYPGARILFEENIDTRKPQGIPGPGSQQ